VSLKNGLYQLKQRKSRIWLYIRIFDVIAWWRL